MVSKIKLVSLVLAVIGTSVVAQEVAEEAFKDLPIISVEELNKQVDALTIDAKSCQQLKIEKLIGNLVYHTMKKEISTVDAQELGIKLEEIESMCKQNGIWEDAPRK